jgi:poly(hydroxyalkanoate) granule-associated protein
MSTTTTMENMSQASLAGKQAASEPGPGTMRQVWWASLGLLAVVGEQTGRLTDTLIRKGKELEPAMKEGFKKAGKEISEATGAVGTQLKGLSQKIGKTPEKAGSLIGGIEGKVSAALDRMGVPSKDEIQSLSRKVDELTAKVEELLAKAEKSTH